MSKNKSWAKAFKALSYEDGKEIYTSISYDYIHGAGDDNSLLNPHPYFPADVDKAFPIQRADLVPFWCQPTNLHLHGITKRCDLNTFVERDRLALKARTPLLERVDASQSDHAFSFPAYIWLLPKVELGCPECLRLRLPCVVWDFFEPQRLGDHWRMEVMGCWRCHVSDTPCSNTHTPILLYCWPKHNSYSFSVDGELFPIPKFEYSGPDHSRYNQEALPPSQVVSEALALTHRLTATPAQIREYVESTQSELYELERAAEGKRRQLKALRAKLAAVEAA